MTQGLAHTVGVGLVAQPIETAPRDGTPIIGISERRYSAGVWRIWWQPEFDAWIESCRMMTLAAGYTYDDGSSRKLHSPEIREPTHWLPYPDLAPSPDPSNGLPPNPNEGQPK